MITQETIEKRPLSATSLKAFRKSPRHYLLYLQKEYIPSDAMVVGSVVDVLTLTPDEFDKRFLVWEKATGKGSVLINQEQKQAAAAKKVTLITKETLSIAKSCVESLYSHDLAKQLLMNRKHVQRKLTWRNKKNNLPLIGYQDFESNVWGDKFIVDLKTANDADPDTFSRQAANLDYEIQPATYLDAYHKLFFQFPNFIFLVVETKEPYNVSLNFCDADYVERAKEEYFGTLNAFRYAMNNYPDFDIGYNFRLMKTRDYFSMTIPKYKRQVYKGFEEV